MRVFIGIDLNEKLKAEIDLWRNKNLKDTSLRFIPKENFHITLIPPWNVKDPLSTIKLLSEKLYFDSFQIDLDKVAYGPKRSQPTLVWATGEPPYEFSQLISELEIVLGKNPQDREPVPHITLARVKRNFTKSRTKFKVDWKIKVKSFTLFESRLYNWGSEYRVIKNFDSV